MESAFTIRQHKTYTVTFSNDDGQIACLDFNGAEMTFAGKADEAAKVFFNYVAAQFSQRLEEEREAARTDSVPAALKEWVLNREPDIAVGLEDFGELHSTFKALFGRDPQPL